MKKYLVKLNQPVLIRNNACGEPIFSPVYGFLAPYSETNEQQNTYYEEIISTYVTYLAAMHEWSAGREDSFYVRDTNWIDREGVVHKALDKWTIDICTRNRKRLGLEYSLYVIDLYGTQGVCPGCGREGSLITCETVMDKLVEISQQQPVRTTEPHTIILFNRPIWMSAANLWEDEPGFCLIYGVVDSCPLDEAKENDLKNYLGYLAMCEEYFLSGTTPSGFSTKDAVTWYKDGSEYSILDKAIQEEGRICREKHNLKIIATELQTPDYARREGVRDGLILGQDLYEHLWEAAKVQTGCQNRPLRRLRTKQDRYPF